jgi:transcriptional regulator with XRE-family HTH domain
VIIHLLDAFVEICCLYAWYHEMLKPDTQISGVDLHALVTATIGQKTNGSRTPTDSARAFGHLLWALCASREVSREEFAARTGLGIERYRQIESGLSEPNFGELSSIAAALDKQAFELVNRWERMSMIPEAVRRDVLEGARSKQVLTKILERLDGTSERAGVHQEEAPPITEDPSHGQSPI